MKVQFELERKNVLVNLLTGFPACHSSKSLQMLCRVFCNLADCEFSQHQNKSGNHEIHRKKKTTHTQCSYSSPGILEITRETEQLRELKAVKVRFAHSKFRIVHAQHKQQKCLLFKLALRSLFIISRAHSLLSRAMSHVLPGNTLFQI